MSEDLKDKAYDKVTELMRRVMTLGVGTLFLTEDALRALTGDFKLPKEVVSLFLEGASKAKSDFFQSLSKELASRFSAPIDPKELIDQIVQKYDFEFNIRLKLEPKNSQKSDEKIR